MITVRLLLFLILSLPMGPILASEMPVIEPIEVQVPERLLNQLHIAELVALLRDLHLQEKSPEVYRKIAAILKVIADTTGGHSLP